MLHNILTEFSTTTKLRFPKKLKVASALKFTVVNSRTKSQQNL